MSFYVGVLLSLFWVQVAYNAGSLLGARCFGFRPERLSIGFGPSLFQFLFGHTTYQVAPLPLGGYVQIAGMNPHEELEPGDRGSFRNGSVFARGITILAGPLGSIIPGFCLLVLAAMVGYPRSAGPLAVVGVSGSAAGSLNRGDRVLRVDAQPVQDALGVIERLSADKSTDVLLTIERNGRTREVLLKPNASGDDRGRYGVTFGRATVVSKASFSKSVLIGAREAGTIISGLAAAVELGIKGHNPGAQLNPIRGQDWRTSEHPSAALVLVGMLALYVGFFNFLPFPAMNGGRLLSLVLEVVGIRIRPRVEAIAHSVGIIVLLLVLVLVSIPSFKGCGSGATETSLDAQVNANLRHEIAAFERATQIHRRWGIDEPTLSI